MKILPLSLCLAMLSLSSTSLAQKVKIYKAKVTHYDWSATRGIVYDVSPQGVVLLDPKSVSAMSAKDIQGAVLNNQLPTFTIPFGEIQEMNIKRRGAAGRSFGLGYLASFVTLETIMAASILSQDKTGCARQKPTLGEALVGASCAAPPGILVIGVVSVLGGGIGSVIGTIASKHITLDPRNQEIDARRKLSKYVLLPQKSRVETQTAAKQSR